MAQHLDLHFVP